MGRDKLGRTIDIFAIAAGIIGLILSLAVLGAGVYLFWVLIKALHKYLAS